MRTTCKDCGGPKGTSSYFSYCNNCGARRQRDRYAAQKTINGGSYNPRTQATSQPPHTTPEEARRQRVLKGHSAPGICDACSEYEPTALFLVTMGDRRDEDHLYGNPSTNPTTTPTAPIPYALWCAKCRAISHALTPEDFTRTVKLAAYLTKEGIEYHQVLPDINEVMFHPERYLPTQPTQPTQPATPSAEQK